VPNGRKVHPHSAGQFSLTGAKQYLRFGLPLPPSGTPSQAELLEEVADVGFDAVLTEREHQRDLTRGRLARPSESGKDGQRAAR
jgi:hypothetical protein